MRFVVVRDPGKISAIGAIYAECWARYAASPRFAARLASSIGEARAQQERSMASSRWLSEHIGRMPALVIGCRSKRIDGAAGAAAAAAYGRLMAHNGIEAMDGPPVLLGQPERIAARLRPYVDLGFRTFIVRLPAPYDTETLARIREVAALLEARGHSCRKAATGSRRDARRAGSMPNRIPVSALDPNAAATANGGTEAATGVYAFTSIATTVPKPSPIRAPVAVSVTEVVAGSITWQR